MKSNYLIILFILFGCKNEINFKIGVPIHNEVFETFKETVKDDIYYRPGGASNIVRESLHLKNNVSWNDTLGVLSIWAFNDNDSCFLLITPMKSSYLKFSFKNNQLQTLIFYWDDTKSFGHGVFVEPDRISVTFKNRAFNLSDTIYGFIDLETKPYLRSGIEYKDKYKGYFASIIVPKDTFLKYQWLR